MLVQEICRCLARMESAVEEASIERKAVSVLNKKIYGSIEA
jgi:hypothetical protein